ncbi:hypothetical protein NDU88_010206 [Pleurodeles waltl]|uniref:Uncharacterized protein n=1 Tax=Pleurodeles waltl TaxID=8319 RepID=A0AAV7S164_PLEWA|nr:hypothetical protein NDU88_010206 [Pleurodeles waltl]
MASAYGERDCTGATPVALLHPNREADMILEIQDEGGEMMRDPEAMPDGSNIIMLRCIIPEPLLIQVQYYIV